MKVRVVSRRELAAGVALAGLEIMQVRDESAAARAVVRCMDDGDVGIVLIDEAFYRRLPRELLARLDRRALPIVAPIPAPRWDERSEAEAYIRHILQQAIGYRVRAR